MRWWALQTTKLASWYCRAPSNTDPMATTQQLHATQDSCSCRVGPESEALSGYGHLGRRASQAASFGGLYLLGLPLHGLRLSWSALFLWWFLYFRFFIVAIFRGFLCVSIFLCLLGSRFLCCWLLRRRLFGSWFFSGRLLCSRRFFLCCRGGLLFCRSCLLGSWFFSSRLLCGRRFFLSRGCGFLLSSRCFLYHIGLLVRYRFPFSFGHFVCVSLT
ncbi:unnamed protein product [Meganyctiphanes norvegica]|uniref:Uncharacterized protein n=1 Tax=Meganyctiphanes norvegica TaxID=48144 RepID=A0AAV2RYR0_MEGNR